jgi:hypothetical protein
VVRTDLAVVSRLSCFALVAQVGIAFAGFVVLGTDFDMVDSDSDMAMVDIEFDRFEHSRFDYSGSHMASTNSCSIALKKYR